MILVGVDESNGIDMTAVTIMELRDGHLWVIDMMTIEVQAPAIDSTCFEVMPPKLLPKDTKPWYRQFERKKHR